LGGEGGGKKKERKENGEKKRKETEKRWRKCMKDRGTRIYGICNILGLSYGAR
jgi:hypothetical protein